MILLALMSIVWCHTHDGHMMELVWLMMLLQVDDADLHVMEMMIGTLAELENRSSSRSSCLCSWRWLVMVWWTYDDDDDVVEVPQRSFKGVVACLDVCWRVEDLLALFPTLFVGLLSQLGSDTWETCLSTCRGVTELSRGLEVSSNFGEEDPNGGRDSEMRACGFSLCSTPIAPVEAYPCEWKVLVTGKHACANDWRLQSSLGSVVHATENFHEKSFAFLMKIRWKLAWKFLENLE